MLLEELARIPGMLHCRSERARRSPCNLAGEGKQDWDDGARSRHAKQNGDRGGKLRPEDGSGRTGMVAEICEKTRKGAARFGGGRFASGCCGKGV